MRDNLDFEENGLAGLGARQWQEGLARIGAAHGTFDALGPRHAAVTIEGSSTLLVTFETAAGIRALNPLSEPLGWALVRDLGLSHLGLVSDGDTWFRDPHVFAHFDGLDETGWFDQFDRVVFYGAATCGHAAAAFSVTAPGATVIAVQPQATLAPAVARWDDRFPDERRRDFSTRYGYAPDLLDAAGRCFILYDPHEALDAMHAALFRGAHVSHVRLPHFGPEIQRHLLLMGVLPRLLVFALAGKLDLQAISGMMRARRTYRPYLRMLRAAALRAERPRLADRIRYRMEGRSDPTGLATTQAPAPACE